MKNSILKLEGVTVLQKKELIKLAGGDPNCKGGYVQLECDGPFMWVPNTCAVLHPYCGDLF
ncbi:hypothetical protein [Flavobacterium sp. '19STA2R22 D10 B1']|uniref:hypothetical protein n=1 Tax=Flavobacterium aerium TaxID=3037261 RepID=UPI00278BC181|nr:hypothetical protein [Flavobacterium sp. '19STA2R22 D10 B1']